MQPAEGPVSRRSRTGLIVAIVVVALVLIGGGTAALMLIDRPAPQARVPAPQPNPLVGGLYTALLPCAKLTTPPFTFDPSNEPFTQGGRTTKLCLGTFGTHRVAVAMTLYAGPNAEADAVGNSFYGDTVERAVRVDGTGFENAPFVAYNGDYGPLCTAFYRRRNLDVRIDFPTLSNVTDVASCTTAIMPYVKALYAVIG